MNRMIHLSKTVQDLLFRFHGVTVSYFISFYARPLTASATESKQYGLRLYFSLFLLFLMTVYEI